MTQPGGTGAGDDHNSRRRLLDDLTYSGLAVDNAVNNPALACGLPVDRPVDNRPELWTAWPLSHILDGARKPWKGVDCQCKAEPPSIELGGSAKGHDRSVIPTPGRHSTGSPVESHTSTGDTCRVTSTPLRAERGKARQ
jgi:hypothetical protein